MNSGLSIGNDGSFDEQASIDEAAKVEQAKQELVDERTGEEPELLMGKYGSTDELISAFKALQGEYSRLKSGSTQAEPESQPEPQASQPPVQQQQQQQQQDVQQEQAKAVVEAIFQQTGGEQKYHAMASWAAKNMDQAAVESFNAAIRSGDKDRAISAVKGMQYDYMTQTGYEPRLIGGRAPVSEGPKGFTSEAQVVAAMADPRYQNGPMQDPAYVKEVEARLIASNVFSD